MNQSIQSALMGVMLPLLMASVGLAEKRSETQVDRNAPGAQRTVNATTADIPLTKPSSAKRLLVLEPTASNVDKATVQIVSGLLPVELAAFEDIEIISGNDVQKMLDLESKKESLGCTAESCLTELADAFGTDFVVFGNIGRLGELYVLTLNLFETATAKSRGRISVRTRTVEELPEILARELPKLLAAVHPAAPGGVRPRAEGNEMASDADSADAPDAVQTGEPASARARARLAMDVAGYSFAVGGILGMGPALVLVGWQGVTLVQGGFEQDDNVYAELRKQSLVLEAEYRKWGPISLTIGGSALGLGILLLMATDWVFPEEVAE